MVRVSLSRPVVVAGIALCMVLAGCSSSGSKNGTSGSATSGKLVPDPSATMRYSGAATVGFSYNPHTYAGGFSNWGQFNMLYDRLLQLTPDDKTIEPMLATSWKFNSTNTQLTMTLRNDVEFQDGSAFNANVAVQNLEVAAKPGSNGQVELADMSNVVAVDPYTIRVTLRSPDPDVVFAFADYAGMMVSPNGLADPNLLTTQPMGSGPYKLVSVDSSLTYHFERFDGYWNKSHVYPAQVDFYNIANETTRFNALRTGTVDAEAISTLSYPSAVADNNLQVAKVPALAMYSVLMNTSIPPLNNVMVRQAISLALNRDAVNADQNGQCTPVDQAFPPGMVGYDPSLKPTFDLVQAKTLIQQAGATGATIKIITVPFEPNETIAKIVQAQLDAAGLNIQILLSTATAYRATYHSGGAGMLFVPTSTTANDPSAVVNQYYLGADNPGTKDPAMVAKIQQAEQLSIGSAPRTSAFQEINKELTTKYLVWAPICQPTYLYAADKKVIGLNAMPESAFSLAANTVYLQIAK